MDIPKAYLSQDTAYLRKAHLRRDIVHIHLAVLITIFYLLALGIIVFLDIYLNPWDWPGFEQKQLWDWHTLFLAPAVTLLAGYLASSRERQQRDSILQTYFDGMRQILVDKEQVLAAEGQPPHDLQVRNHVDALARWLTLATLMALGPDRKNHVLQFLHESNLIHQDQQGQVFVSLANADLRLGNLAEANLTGADLTEAKLAGADLTSVNVTQDQLSSSKSLEDATMPDGSKHD